MKPEVQSQRVLSITQAKAKMFEYDVPLSDHITLANDPSRLFLLTIGQLGDIAAKINAGVSSEEEIRDLRNNLLFSARFFDAFVDAELSHENEQYVRLLGAAAYYLCNIPGSSGILAKSININQLNIGAFGLEIILLWSLQIENFPVALPEIPRSLFRELLLEIHSRYVDFNSNGTGVDHIFETAQRIKKTAYEVGTPRQLLLADLVGAVVRRRIENSTWTCLPKYTSLPLSVWADVINKSSFIKEFWPAQHLLGEKGIFQGNSAVVQMPTSAGKTKATEIIIRSAFLANRAFLAVIIAPFRALCHEIRQSLRKAFFGEMILIDELSDVLQHDYSIERFLDNQQVLIATPEKFNYILRHEPDLAQRIGLMVYDEGHQFDNGTRGITYELLLTSLKSRLPGVSQTILISAVISNAKKIGEWLINERAQIIEGLTLIPTFKSIGFSTVADSSRNLYFVRPSNPDEIEFFVPRIFKPFPLKRKKEFPNFTEGKELALFLGLKLVHQGSVAIFCGTKDSVGAICRTAVEKYQRGLTASPPLDYSNRAEVQKLKNLFGLNLGSESILTQCSEKGIFAHHNNVPHGLRLSIEYAVKENLVKFVVCTSTLAQGVNLPIRYLIVTSVYQGEEQISVRDFQNLIGRSGRSGMHTEGSILFADPELYDDRTKNFVGRQNWRKVKELLDPSKSEGCGSKLLTFFEPLYSTDKRYSIEIEPQRLVEMHLEGAGALSEWIRGLADQHNDKKFTENDLQKQIDQKINIISAVENYLMANWDSSQDNSAQEGVITLAKGTLAYYLADDGQKKQIEDFFDLLARVIIANVPDVSKRMIFGKTMYGVPESIVLSRWLDENIVGLASANSIEEKFEILWSILSDYFHNRSLKKCNKQEAVKSLAFSWLEGTPFQNLLGNLQESGAKLIWGAQLRDYKIENVVDICENSFAYEGVLTVGAITELIPLLPIDNVSLLVETLQLLQKRLKYGLPSQTSIILYELGFADRVVAIDLSSLFIETVPDKEHFILALNAQREEIFEKLDNYPSYFSEVYRNLAARA